MVSTLASRHRESAPPTTLRKHWRNLVCADAKQVVNRITVDEQKGLMAIEEEEDDADTNDKDKDEGSDTDDE